MAICRRKLEILMGDGYERCFERCYMSNEGIFCCRKSIQRMERQFFLDFYVKMSDRCIG